jgi:hypothetical protein
MNKVADQQAPAHMQFDTPALNEKGDSQKEVISY